MVMKTKVRKIGNSYGIVLPKEALHTMKVKEGDTLYITEGAENSVRLAAQDEQFARAMEIADRGMRKYRNALRELAK